MLRLLFGEPVVESGDDEPGRRRREGDAPLGERGAAGDGDDGVAEAHVERRTADQGCARDAEGGQGVAVVGGREGDRPRAGDDADRVAGRRAATGLEHPQRLFEPVQRGHEVLPARRA